jgi:tetratricopeptide (TPR) repeat protein
VDKQDRIKTGKALFERGLYDSAIQLFSSYIERERVPEHYYNRGCAYEAKGDSEMAVADYSRALRTDSGYLPAAYARSSLLLARGDTLNAQADANRLGSGLNLKDAGKLKAIFDRNSETLARIARESTRSFLDSEGKIDFAYPNDWVLVESKQRTEKCRQALGYRDDGRLFWLEHMGSPQERLSILLRPTELNEPPSEAYWLEYAKILDVQLAGTMPGFRKVSQRMLWIRGMWALEHTSEASTDSGSVRVVQLMFSGGKIEYTIAMVARSGEFDLQRRRCYDLVKRSVVTQ